MKKILGFCLLFLFNFLRVLSLFFVMMSCFLLPVVVLQIFGIPFEFSKEYAKFNLPIALSWTYLLIMKNNSYSKRYLRFTENLITNNEEYDRGKTTVLTIVCMVFSFVGWSAIKWKSSYLTSEESVLLLFTFMILNYTVWSYIRVKSGETLILERKYNSDDEGSSKDLRKSFEKFAKKERTPKTILNNILKSGSLILYVLGLLFALIVLMYAIPVILIKSSEGSINPIISTIALIAVGSGIVYLRLNAGRSKFLLKLYNKDNFFSKGFSYSKSKSNVDFNFVEDTLKAIKNAIRGNLRIKQLKLHIINCLVVFGISVLFIYLSIRFSLTDSAIVSVLALLCIGALLWVFIYILFALMLIKQIKQLLVPVVEANMFEEVVELKEPVSYLSIHSDSGKTMKSAQEVKERPNTNGLKMTLAVTPTINAIITKISNYEVIAKLDENCNLEQRYPEIRFSNSYAVAEDLANNQVERNKNADLLKGHFVYCDDFNIEAIFTPTFKEELLSLVEKYNFIYEVIISTNKDNKSDVHIRVFETLFETSSFSGKATKPYVVKDYCLINFVKELYILLFNNLA